MLAVCGVRNLAAKAYHAMQRRQTQLIKIKDTHDTDTFPATEKKKTSTEI